MVVPEVIVAPRAVRDDGSVPFVKPQAGVTPVAAADLVTKAYADALGGGVPGTFRWKEPVRVATTANVNLSNGLENGDTIDGVTLATGDRVLVKSQTTASENGPYIVPASGAASRATDGDTGAKLVGAIIPVLAGSTNADKVFVVTNDAITLGSTSIVVASLVSLLGTIPLSQLASVTGGVYLGRLSGSGAVGEIKRDTPAEEALDESHYLHYWKADGSIVRAKLSDLADWIAGYLGI